MTTSYGSLRDTIDEHFNLGELEALCFTLGVDFDNLRGEIKVSKAQSLIVHFIELRQIDLLIHQLEKLRPSVEWSKFPLENYIKPYRGLSVFYDVDVPFFFGRTNFTKRLITAVYEQSLIAVIGSSGGGKSSVVFAGLVPHLKETGIWESVYFRPGNQPFQNLALALNRQLTLPAPISSQTLEDNPNILLTKIISDMELSQDHRCLLIIDQFEELFTLCPEVKTRQNFMETIVTVQRAASYVTVLLTMRADFMEQAVNYQPFADALQGNLYILSAMTPQELRQAIELPALVVGVPFQAGLVNRIIDDLGDEAGRLPLLEFALTLLWEQPQNGLLTHEAYDEIKGVEGALAQYAENVFTNLNQTEQEQANQIFLQLVQPGVGTQDTRRQATRSEIGNANWTLVQRLADERLVVTNKPTAADEQVIIEITHEALIQEWGRLRGWMDKERQFRVWQEQLRAVIRQWKDSGEDDGALWRGYLLDQAQVNLRIYRERLSDPEVHFIEESIALHQKEKRRQSRQVWQKRSMIGAVSLLILLFIIFAIDALAWRTVFDKDSVREMKVVNTNPPIYFLGSLNSGLYRSRDGEDWTRFQANLPRGNSEPPLNVRPIRLVAVDSQDESRVFIHVAEHGIFYAILNDNSDEDTEWHSANAGLTDILTNTLITDLDISGQWGTAVVNTQAVGSLYISQNGGLNWEPADKLSCAQPPQDIRTTYISPIDNTIYVGATGGVYQLQDRESCISWNLILTLPKIWLMDAQYTDTSETFYLVSASEKNIKTERPIYQWSTSSPTPVMLANPNFEAFAMTANSDVHSPDKSFVLSPNGAVVAIGEENEMRTLWRTPLGFSFTVIVVPDPSGQGRQLWLGHEKGVYMYQYLR